MFDWGPYRRHDLWPVQRLFAALDTYGMPNRSTSTFEYNGNGPAHGPGSAAGGRQGASPLLAVGILMLVGALAIVAFVFLRDLSLAGSRPAGGVVATTPNGLVSSGPTVTASYTPTLAPTSPPTLAQPAALFAALLDNEPVSYHVEIAVTVRSNSQNVSITASGNQSGQDMSLSIAMRRDGRTARAQLVEKGDVWYVKRANQPWSQESAPPDQFTALLSPGTATDVEYVGAEKHDGRQLHRLAVNVERPPEIERMLSEVGCDLANQSALFWVEADGTPVSAEYAYTCWDGREDWDVSSTYEFSRFGKPIEIRVPAAFRP